MLYSQYVNKPSPEELWYLSKEAVENPQAIIYRFYDTYGLMVPHQRLWEMFKLMLGNDETDNWNSMQRSNYIHFFEMLKELINANYILFLKLRKEKDFSFSPNH
jgi:hypothetical protein